jgi:hypothetical protein
VDEGGKEQKRGCRRERGRREEVEENEEKE